MGGQRYRVVSSASPEELERLARVVDDKLAALVPPGRPITPQALLLAAMALAHDLDEERARFAALQHDTGRSLVRTLGRVDEALASIDGPVAELASAGRSTHPGDSRLAGQHGANDPSDG